MNPLYLYCQDAWQGLHGYLSIVVCVLGVFFNLLNILVLGHREMRANPINLILFSIAVADILLMLEYIPFTVHMYILDQHTRTREEKVCSSWSWKRRSTKVTITKKAPTRAATT